MFTCVICLHIMVLTDCFRFCITEIQQSVSKANLVKTTLYSQTSSRLQRHFLLGTLLNIHWDIPTLLADGGKLNLKSRKLFICANSIRPPLAINHDAHSICNLDLNNKSQSAPSLNRAFIKGAIGNWFHLSCRPALMKRCKQGCGS